MDTSAIVLAGGENSRMQGRNKALLALNNRRFIDYLLDRLQPQVANTLISRHQQTAQFPSPDVMQICDLPISSDSDITRLGPLAGVYTGLKWLQQHQPNTRWALTVPSDSPLIPRSLLRQLSAKCGDARLVYATNGNDAHYLTALWHLSLTDRLEDYLNSGRRSAHQFLKHVDAVAAEVRLSDHGDESFANVNTPNDYQVFVDTFKKHVDQE
jgi:Molybdopterin-guanine dinucleotide biosynthesis protein A